MSQEFQCGVGMLGGVDLASRPVWFGSFRRVCPGGRVRDLAHGGLGQDSRGRVEALLRDVEMRKMRKPRIEAGTRARNALFAPFVLSANGAHVFLSVFQIM